MMGFEYPRQDFRLTPLSANCNFLAKLLDMSKAKVVVTRNLNESAQELLDTQCHEVEVVQWRFDKVRHTLDR